MAGLTRSAIGITLYGNPSAGDQPLIPVGPTNSVYWSNGVVNAFSTDPIVNSIGLGPVLAPKAATGLIGVPHNQVVLAGRNNANTQDRALITWGSSTDQLFIGDSSVAEVWLISNGNQLRLRNGGFWTNATGTPIIIQPSSSAINTDGTPGVLRGQALTNSGASSIAGEAILEGAEHFGTGAAFTFTGGQAIVRGGASLGAGGTHIGGDVWIAPGQGTTRNGNTYFGTSDPLGYNFQGMVGGIAVQTAAVAPTVAPASHTTFWCDGTGILRTLGSWALGTGTPSGTGLIRFGHGQAVLSGRNNANTQNRNLFTWGTAGTDDWTLGDNTAGVQGTIFVGSGNTLTFQFGANQIVLPGTVAAAATAGAGVLPATPQEFLNITVLGNARKIPLYLN